MLMLLNTDAKWCLLALPNVFYVDLVFADELFAQLVFYNCTFYAANCTNCTGLRTKNALQQCNSGIFNYLWNR